MSAADATTIELPVLRAGEPTPDEIAEQGLWSGAALRDAEYLRACELLGRRPTWTEASIIGVMWSEHCSYKSSKHLLRTLPTSGDAVLQGPGENAGVVDLGDGWAAAFKVESHNHPSAVEPYQGAATGVGGILRDVFTMGARPVAILDSLRFGPIDDETAGDGAQAARTRRLMAGVVAGIAGYGNCVGVPTVGGEVEFDAAYAHNPLVNAMCIGVLRHEELQLGSASGTGNPVMYVGARTGRDGIHGATFASVEDPHAHERSAVQVGDPFREKLLIEACLELYATGIVVGVQDMGAAGLTSSSVEMAARAGSGIVLDLDRVPRREPGMAPFELMLSESQERMLVVVREGTETVAHELFERWDLDCAEVGRVVDDGTLTLREEGSVVCRLPLSMLVDDTPEYRWPSEPQPIERIDAAALAAIEDVNATDAGDVLCALLARPTIASKCWIHEQFDSMVGAATAVRPGSDAAVIRLRGTDRAIAASIDCVGRWCARDPYAGAMHAVAEATRNVACSGARPLAITDCLNFSSPEQPHVAWQLEQAIAGIGDACRALDTPVVSGNVSLYNRTGDVDVHPTPVIGAVGVLEDANHATTSAWTNGLDVLLLGPLDSAALDAAEYLAVRGHAPAGGAPPIDLDAEVRVQRVVRTAIEQGLVASAHDCSDGGLAVTLAECAIAGRVGADLDLTAVAAATGRLDVALFGEGASRIVVQATTGNRAALEALAREHGADCTWLGAATGERLRLRVDAATIIDEPTTRLAQRHDGAIPALMNGVARP
jgi:phosphoribosylformylglycinamidine synthase